MSRGYMSETTTVMCTRLSVFGIHMRSVDPLSEAHAGHALASSPACELVHTNAVGLSAGVAANRIHESRCSARASYQGRDGKQRCSKCAIASYLFMYASVTHV